MRPSDSHWDLLTPGQRTHARVILQTLRRHNLRHVLGGGWAVYAHESTTPSIDCDVFLERPLSGRPRDELSAAGIRVGSMMELDALPLDEPQDLLGTGEEDLGILPASYVPSTIFNQHLESRTLQLDQEIHGVPVPDRIALSVTKLAAMQGRTLAYRSFIQGEARMRVGPGAIAQVESVGQTYYLRKAGKDLFDASLLLTTDSHREEARRLAGPRIWSEIQSEAAAMPNAIREMATDMAARVGKTSPSALLDFLV